ncbi:hypothetical protein CHS0354_030834 [Potamilus streckersoni]|uniref:Uncharacterized protein n=1 Tax=Potamilus streckersoni TaxID=2493646 RepID=A0AAE0WCD0_9BIVA|nr:hypothetical protein CHS0354_030834 [Potamilus streckersoni]
MVLFTVSSRNIKLSWWSSLQSVAEVTMVLFTVSSRNKVTMVFLNVSSRNIKSPWSSLLSVAETKLPWSSLLSVAETSSHHGPLYCQKQKHKVTIVFFNDSSRNIKSPWSSITVSSRNIKSPWSSVLSVAETSSHHGPLYFQ